MALYQRYINFILLSKIIFITLATSHLYFKSKPKYTELDKRILYYKEKVEFIFGVLMACLLIYLFNPWNERTQLTNETKYVLFLFGNMLIIKSPWETFIHEPLLFKNIQYVM